MLALLEEAAAVGAHGTHHACRHRLGCRRQRGRRENKSIELADRNGDQNEDEDSTPNMRNGGTNYFIFPGESGQDPEWLVGETVKSWRGLVSMAFEANGKSYSCDPFVLVPHDAL